MLLLRCDSVSTRRHFSRPFGRPLPEITSAASAAAAAIADVAAVIIDVANTVIGIPRTGLPASAVLYVLLLE